MILRHTQAVWVPIVIWLFCAFALGDAIVEGSTGYALRMALLTFAIAAMAYAVLARPALKLDDAGITVVNVARTHRIPFGTLEDVRVGGLTALVVHTSTGDRKITSWNAPGVKRRRIAPRRPGLLGDALQAERVQELRQKAIEEKQIERLIRNRWESWRSLNAGSTTDDVVSSRWNTSIGVIVLGLVVTNIAIWLR